MNYKQIEERKRAYSSLNWDLYRSASTIAERFPDCKCVKISVKIRFTSAFGVHEKDYQRNLLPTDKLHLHFDCVNGDCTGNGFSLTNQLWNSLQSKSEISGELRCEGKEDWKYIHSSGNTCYTTLFFKITPYYEI